MADAPRFVTAAELEKLSPQARTALLRERIVTDLDDLSPDFRARVVATGERLARERRTARDG